MKLLFTTIRGPMPREFDLPPDRTIAKYAIHWDIGQSWR